MSQYTIYRKVVGEGDQQHLTRVGEWAWKADGQHIEALKDFLQGMYLTEEREKHAYYGVFGKTADAAQYDRAVLKLYEVNPINPSEPSPMLSVGEE